MTANTNSAITLKPEFQIQIFNIDWKGSEDDSDLSCYKVEKIDNLIKDGSISNSSESKRRLWSTMNSESYPLSYTSYSDTSDEIAPKKTRNTNSGFETIKFSYKSKFENKEIQFDNGDFYEGNVNQKGTLWGKGVYVTKEGTKIEGSWKNGKLNNLVKFFFIEGGEFEIRYDNGIPSRSGIITYPNGVVYDGNVILDEEGIITIPDASGFNVPVDIETMIPHGVGTMYLPNPMNPEQKDKVIGTWEKGKLQGNVLIKFINQDSYSGEWQNGVPVKESSHSLHIDRNAYVGTWKEVNAKNSDAHNTNAKKLLLLFDNNDFYGKKVPVLEFDLFEDGSIQFCYYMTEKKYTKENLEDED